MNTYFFNRANAEARAQQIRDEAEAHRKAGEHAVPFTRQEEATPEQQAEVRAQKIRAAFRPQHS